MRGNLRSGVPLVPIHVYSHVSLLLTLYRLFCLCYPCTVPVYDVSGQRAMGGFSFLTERVFTPLPGQICARIRDENSLKGSVLSPDWHRAKSSEPCMNPVRRLSARRTEAGRAVRCGQ